MDYVLTRQRDIGDIRLTRVMRGTSTWSDHRLVRCSLYMSIRRARRYHRTKKVRKLNVAAFKNPDMIQSLQANLNIKISESGDTAPATEWHQFKTMVYESAAASIGYSSACNKDWFDEQDQAAKPLLDKMHATHLSWINDKKCSSKRQAYVVAKREAQIKLRSMKERWWAEKAAELQKAADRHDMKAFYDGLKAVYGPRVSGSVPVRSQDNTLLTDHQQILARWAEHFKSVLNQASSFDVSVLAEIPQREVADYLACPPSQHEVSRAIKCMASGKAPGADGLPAEVFKHGGPHLTRHLTHILNQMWHDEEVPQDFRDAQIIHIFKRKGDRSVCDNHRGIALLSIPGKILARVILNRLSTYVSEIGLLPESQCGFRSGRGTMDMIFTARQLQEKCREQNRDLLAVFVDLTKAFDSVNRPALWAILHKIGCPAKFVNIIRSFHEGMEACVIEAGETSPKFAVTNGTKQGCVLAPLLFSIFFSMTLLVAFRDCEVGIPIQFRTDGNIFNLRRFQAKTKVHRATIRDLLFADDCALMAHTLTGLQELMNRFAIAASRFGLTVSIKKTEVMYQACTDSNLQPPTISVGNSTLATVDQFTYLGSVLSNSSRVDNDIAARLAKASTAFGKLQTRLWNEHGITLQTKLAVYRAVVMSTLLYGSEAWTLYRHHVKRLDQFHMRCLRKIAHIRWQDKIPNTEVLRICNMTGIEAVVIGTQLRWVGHVSRMPDDRIPKQVFYAELPDAPRPLGRPLLRYRDTLKANLRACGMKTDFLQLTLDRPKWRHTCQKGTSLFESSRIEQLTDKRFRRKNTTQQTTRSDQFVCTTCGRRCLSRIGHYSHIRSHR